jgi:uncharacterized protein (DUF1697 family)
MSAPRTSTRYVALLRAINVRGHAQIAMADLCDAFGQAGCRNVSSYIQSGNVLFETTVRDREALFAKITARVRAVSGPDTSIVFRTIRELDAAARAAPFGSLADDNTIKLYVVFLAARAKRTPTLPIVDAKERLELVGVRGAHAYVVSRRKPNTMMYGFPNSFVENALGVAATSRNWSTVTKILARTTPDSGSGSTPGSDRGAAAPRGVRAGSRSRAS